ncbi:MAG: RNA polymerase sigma factor [Planctomycetes bacterium]|nr:RNA polymerase sigma factor [Planctomycetota bacterium]
MPATEFFSASVARSESPCGATMTQRSERLLENLTAFVAFARRRVGDPELAADAVQEALLKALAHADSVRDEERLVAWFYRILRNTLADLIERRGRERVRSAPDVPEDDLAAPAETLAAVCACLGTAIDALPGAQAELLRAVDLGGEETAAAARRLGITPNNLKVRRHRARQALHKSLLQTCKVCATHGCIECECGKA